MPPFSFVKPCRQRHSHLHQHFSAVRLACHFPCRLRIYLRQPRRPRHSGTNQSESLVTADEFICPQPRPRPGHNSHMAGNNTHLGLYRPCPLSLPWQNADTAETRQYSHSPTQQTGTTTIPSRNTRAMTMGERKPCRDTRTGANKRRPWGKSFQRS